MEISISPKMENLLRDKVTEGLFGSMDEAVNFAIQVTFVDKNIIKERINLLNSEIEKGWQDMEQGRYRDGKDVMEEFKRKYA